MSGQEPLPNAEQIEQAFANNIAGVVSGALGGLRSATSIFDARTGVQLKIERPRLNKLIQCTDIKI